MFSVDSRGTENGATKYEVLERYKYQNPTESLG